MAGVRKVSVARFVNLLSECSPIATAVMEEEGESAAQDDVGADKFKQMMRIKSVHALSFFALIYVGIEVTLGGERALYGCCFPELVNLATRRLECDVHTGKAWRKCKLRLHLFRILWR